MKKMPALPEGYTARPATLDDVPDIVALLNVCSLALLGIEEHDAEHLAVELQLPSFNLATDSRLIAAPDGQIVAYYDLWGSSEPYVNSLCWGHIHPEHAGRGLGAYLLAWAEERARRDIAKAPPEARVVLTSFVFEIDEVANERLIKAGFQAVRYGLRMVIDLEEEPAAPQWPDGITVRTHVLGQDDRATVVAVRDSFRDHWGHVERPLEEELERWRHFMHNDPNFDPTLYFLAMDGEEIAGVSLCWPKLTGEPDMGWVGTLGVRRPWRRQGLGLALLQHSFGEFYRRGKRRVGLGVDAQSLTGATRLYLKAGMRPDRKRQMNTYHKELRPGIDLSTQMVEPDA